MVLRFFKSGQPALLFFIPVFAGLLWLKYFIIAQPVQLVCEPNPMPFRLLMEGLLARQMVLGKIITLSILIFNALWLSRINTRFIILQQRTYLPAIIYLLVVSCYQPLQQLNPAVFASLFLVLSVEIIFGSYKKEGLALEFFMAAFLISIASLLYARAAILMLFLWTGLAILRSLRWREWVFTILGFITPYIFLFSWYYLDRQSLSENWEVIRYNFVHDRGTGYLNNYYFIFFGYLLILILLATRKMLGTFQGLKIYIRKFFILNLWIFIIILAAYLVIYSKSIEMIYFLAVPVSYILTYFFLNIRSKWIGEILFSLLLAAYGILLIFN